MKIRFMFLRNKKLQPVGCLAISRNDDCSEVFYQYSVLNPSDNFNRKLARDLATGRLANSPIKIDCLNNTNFNNMTEVTAAVMDHLEATSSAPTRARKAAKLWLEGYV